MGNHATPLHADSTEVQAAPAGSLAPRYRWTILFCAWMAFMLSYVDRVAWSSVAAPVGQALSLQMPGMVQVSFGEALRSAAGGGRHPRE